MSAYSTGLSQRLTATHHLPGGPPEEEVEHSHDYLVEIRVSGGDLDDKGYLVDICALDVALKKVLDDLRGRSLNDRPELKGAPPSIENLSRMIWARLAKDLADARIDHIEVKVWESGEAWASYSQEVGR
jgi:6-pyruvoyltetrahydropterin/6-carboxytetrahydropterin synthase